MQLPDNAGANHPLALRMGVIAFISQNLAIGCMYGSIGVLLIAVEARMDVGRTLSSLPVPLVMIGVAVIASFAGILASKLSLRLLLMIGSAMGAFGYALLAVAGNIYVHLLAYALFVGPCVCLSGTVLPATLVTRWFVANRGRALGFVHIPLAMSVLPLVCAFVLRTYGLPTVYAMLSALMVLSLIPMLFIVEFPPDTVQPEAQAASASAEASWTNAQLLRSPRFWALTLAWAATISSAVMLGAHLVPMATGWGYSTSTAALLITLNATAAMAGSPVFGWVADRLSGRMTLVLVCLDTLILYGSLLLHPPFAALALIIILIGLHAGAAIPSFGLALTEQFGPASFGRAYGLGNSACLPFTIATVPVAATIFMKTGSYSGALILQAGFFLLAGILVVTVVGRPAPRRRATVAAPLGG